MEKTHRYDLDLDWSGAGDGAALNYDTYSRQYRIEIAGKPPLMGSSDPAFLGNSSLYNPEDLLLAALSACHMLSYLALCARSRLTVIAYSDSASGTLGETAPHRMAFSEAILRPRVTIPAGADPAKANTLHDRAHAICFIANSVNFPVRHEAEIVVADSGTR
jgi:organic hydroperoxide reductase OsmC/OhrA